MMVGYRNKYSSKCVQFLMVFDPNQNFVSCCIAFLICCPGFLRWVHRPVACGDSTARGNSYRPQWAHQYYIMSCIELGTDIAQWWNETFDLQCYPWWLPCFRQGNYFCMLRDPLWQGKLVVLRLRKYKWQNLLLICTENLVKLVFLTREK
jgi:hypothetical protein